MPYTAQQRMEREAFQQFIKSLPSSKGICYVQCPKCYKVYDHYVTEVNGLNKWAFTYCPYDKVYVTYDKRMCTECWDKLKAID